MVKDLYDSNLMRTFARAGMDFLIPAFDTSYDDDEGLGHGLCDPHDPDEWEIERYYENGYDDDDDLLDYERRKEFLAGERIHNLDDLMLGFGYDTMEPDEFVRLDAWDLFGLTLPQFKMIDVSFLNLMNIFKFVQVLKSEQYSYLSVEQKVKWSTCVAVTDCDRYPYGFPESVPHCIHISNLYAPNKAISLIRLYSDYLRFYPNALLMNERRNQTNLAGGNEPLFDYTVCPKPSKIKDLHDKAFRDFQVIETERAKMQREQLDSMIRDSSSNPGYTRFLHKDPQFMLVAPKSYADFEYEGEVLNHCIASYADQFAKMETFIYFLRKVAEPDKPYFSIEVLPVNNGAYYSLNQCYTYNDAITKSGECRQFIEDWCKKFNIKINCEL